MRYDTTLKEMLQAGAPRLWELLLGEQPREFLTVELPSVKMRKPDFVAWLESGAFAHLEMQSDNDDEMEWRELEYYHWLNRLYGVPPLQIVLYFGSETLRMRHFIAHPTLHFRYTIIDIRNVKGEALLTSGSLSDQVLGMLSDAQTQAEAVRRVLSHIKELPDNEKHDWLERIMALAGLRGAEPVIAEEANKMSISLDIRNNKFFQEAFHYGREEGHMKGHTEGQLAVVEDVLETRFGALPDWARQKLSSLDQAALADARKRMLTATTLENFFAEPLVN